MRIKVIIPTNTSGRCTPSKKGTAAYTFSGIGQYSVEKVNLEWSPS